MYPFYAFHTGEIQDRDRLQASDTPGNHRWVQNQDSNGNPDGSYHLEIRVYNNSGGALVKGQPYVVQPTGVQGTNLAIITPAALAAVPRHVVVAMDTSANATWCWVAVAGWVNLNITGAQTIGQFFKLAPGTSATAFVADGATQSASSIGVVATTRASGTGVDRAFLPGDAVVVNT